MRPPLFPLTIALCAWILAAPSAADSKQIWKVREARWVLDELVNSESPVVPRELLEDTRCVAIFPGIVKGAFGFGGRRGKGVASCRTQEGRWSPPSFLKLSEGSFGLQAGYQETDLLVFFVTEAGARSLLEPKLALGGDASVAAGEIDHAAGVSTDMRLKSDVYLYARSSGFFAGVSVEGSQLSAAPKAIRRYYGRQLWPESILFDQEVPRLPPEAQALMDSLSEWPIRPWASPVAEPPSGEPAVEEPPAEEPPE